jgi:hypothetical protein
MAELSSVNNHIARFVLLLLDADAGRREQLSVADETHLAGRLVDLGHALQDRANRRGPTPGGAGPVVEVPGPKLRRQFEPGRKMIAAGGKP